MTQSRVYMRFTWEKSDNPLAIKFRRQYDLDSVVKSAKDEYEKQLLLKSWVHKSLQSGNPQKDYSRVNAFEIMDDAIKGKRFWCTQYAQLYLQSGVALGFYTRKLGVDSEDPKTDMHHGVTDIWSSKFEKWYVVDAQNNLHFEKDGIPLNALEIRREYIHDKGCRIKGVVGNHEKQVQFNSNSTGYNSPSNYFWFFISLRNNFFERPGLYDTKALLWIDTYNKDKVWMRGGKKEKKLYPHPMYKSQFVQTSSIAECFPGMK